MYFQRYRTLKRNRQFCGCLMTSKTLTVIKISFEYISHFRSDKTLQNVVYKLVPGLYKNETERRKRFQEKRKKTFFNTFVFADLRKTRFYSIRKKQKWSKIWEILVSF